MLLKCTLVILPLLLLLQSSYGEYFSSSVNTQNGTVNINHKTTNSSIRVRYANLHRNYPNVTILRRLSDYSRQSVKLDISSNDSLSIKQSTSSITMNNNTPSTLPPPSDNTLPIKQSASSTITNNNKTLPPQPTVSVVSNKLLLNTSHPHFNNNQVEQIYTDLLLCRKHYKDIENRLLDINNRYLNETIKCENDFKTLSDNMCNKTEVSLNSTDDLEMLRSDLAACVANTEGLEFERNKYIAQYMRCKNSRCTTTIPSTTTTSATTTESALDNLQWQYLSCVQELQRTNNQLTVCKHNSLFNH